MKLPLWYKDKKGQWHPTPEVVFRLLETYTDGKQGISGDNLYKTAHTELDFVTFWDLFEWDKPKRRYLLRENKG